MSENKYLQWLSSTQSIYWHDSAVRAEQEIAFANGAVGMTTNPFLIHATLTSDRAFWQDRLAQLPADLTGDEKVQRLVHTVTGYYAEQVMPIFEKDVAGHGYVCAQTNPNKTGDAEYMIKQLQELASWSKNIVVKVPATNAGIKAYEEGVALGLNMAATVSFTVPQVLAVGEAAARGKERCIAAGKKPGLTIAVMMVGRLDDYLRDVAHDSGADVSESDLVQAGIACMKKAYKIFQERGYDTYLMPAGCRGANQVIDRLMTMPEFRKAYLEDGMTREEFITFGSANRTTDQFINDGWNPLTAYKY